MILTRIWLSEQGNELTVLGAVVYLFVHLSSTCFICVANTDHAFLLMRYDSYITGESMKERLILIEVKVFVQFMVPGNLTIFLW